MVILASTDIHRDCFFSHFMCVYYSVIECLSYDNSQHGRATKSKQIRSVTIHQCNSRHSKRQNEQICSKVDTQSMYEGYIRREIANEMTIFLFSALRSNSFDIILR